MEFSKTEKDLLLQSLKMEWHTLDQTKNNLVRRNLHNGNQNVAIQQRMVEIATLMDKISKD